MKTPDKPQFTTEDLEAFADNNPFYLHIIMHNLDWNIMKLPIEERQRFLESTFLAFPMPEGYSEKSRELYLAATIYKYTKPTPNA